MAAPGHRQDEVAALAAEEPGMVKEVQRPGKRTQVKSVKVWQPMTKTLTPPLHPY